MCCQGVCACWWLTDSSKEFSKAGPEICGTRLTECREYENRPFFTLTYQKRENKQRISPFNSSQSNTRARESTVNSKEQIPKNSAAEPLNETSSEKIQIMTKSLLTSKEAYCSNPKFTTWDLKPCFLVECPGVN